MPSDLKALLEELAEAATAVVSTHWPTGGQNTRLEEAINNARAALAETPAVVWNPPPRRTRRVAGKPERARQSPRRRTDEAIIEGDATGVTEADARRALAARLIATALELLKETPW